MTRMYASMLAGGAAVLLLAAVHPAAAVMRQGDAGATGARPADGAATPSSPTVNREGFVQAVDMQGHTIVINSTRYVIGAPQLLLLDKRPKSDGLLTLAGVKIGSFVRYRVQPVDGAQRVVELWVIRDPQQTLGTKP